MMNVNQWGGAAQLWNVRCPSMAWQLLLLEDEVSVREAFAFAMLSDQGVCGADG